MDQVVTEWGEVATAGKAAGSLGPAWKMFIKTKFYAAILRSPDDDPKNFLLHMERAAGRAATLIISESRERLDGALGDTIIPMSGTDIVCRIEDEGAIDVLFGAGTYSISKKRVEWLRSGIKMTKERIEIRQRLAAAAPAAPMPVLRRAPETAARPDAGPDTPIVSEPPLFPERAAAAAADDAAAPLWQSPYFKPAAITLGIAAAGIAVAVLVNMGPGSAVPPPLQNAMPALAAAHAPAPVAPAPGAMAGPMPPPVTFTPMDNSFTVSVPGLAEEIELTPDQVARLGDTRTHQYKLAAGGMTYTMESTDFLTPPPQDRSAEMDAVQSLIVGNDGKLIRATPIGLRGATGRDVRVRLPDNGERAARFVFRGSKLCMVTVTAPAGAQWSPQIDAFIESFQLR